MASTPIMALTKAQHFLKQVAGQCEKIQTCWEDLEHVSQQLVPHAVSSAGEVEDTINATTALIQAANQLTAMGNSYKARLGVLLETLKGNHNGGEGGD